MPATTAVGQCARTLQNPYRCPNLTADDYYVAAGIFVLPALQAIILYCKGKILLSRWRFRAVEAWVIESAVHG